MTEVVANYPNFTATLRIRNIGDSHATISEVRVYNVTSKRELWTSISVSKVVGPGEVVEINGIEMPSMSDRAITPSYVIEVATEEGVVAIAQAMILATSLVTVNGGGDVNFSLYVVNLGNITLTIKSVYFYDVDGDLHGGIDLEKPVQVEPRSGSCIEFIPAIDFNKAYYFKIEASEGALTIWRAAIVANVTLNEVSDGNYGVAVYVKNIGSTQVEILRVYVQDKSFVIIATGGEGVVVDPKSYVNVLETSVGPGTYYVTVVPAY